MCCSSNTCCSATRQGLHGSYPPCLVCKQNSDVELRLVSSHRAITSFCSTLDGTFAGSHLILLSILMMRQTQLQQCQPVLCVRRRDGTLRPDFLWSRPASSCSKVDFPAPGSPRRSVMRPCTSMQVSCTRGLRYMTCLWHLLPLEPLSVTPRRISRQICMHAQSKCWHETQKRRVAKSYSAQDRKCLAKEETSWSLDCSVCTAWQYDVACCCHKFCTMGVRQGNARKGKARP